MERSWAANKNGDIIAMMKWLVERFDEILTLEIAQVATRVSKID